MGDLKNTHVGHNTDKSLQTAFQSSVNDSNSEYINMGPCFES